MKKIPNISRRYLLETTGKALPMLAVLGLAVVSTGPASASDCAGSCESGCKGTCEGGCTGTCEGGCKGTCEGTSRL